jgi:hypothetical protein
MRRPFGFAEAEDGDRSHLELVGAFARARSAMHDVTSRSRSVKRDPRGYSFAAALALA